MWILGLAVLGQMGCVQGMLGYLSLYLHDIGWSGASADGTLAAFNAASMVGVLPLVFLSNKLRSRKLALLAAIVLTAVCVGLLSVTDNSLVWVLVIVAGIVRDGFMAILITTIMEVDRIGAVYASTALGLVMPLAQLGGFASPPLGNSLADVNPSLPFVFWAALAAIPIVGFYFLRQKSSSATDSVN